MDQVSRPVLIALAATIILIGVWFVALRPKPVAIEKTPLAPTKVVPSAKQASAASDAANAKLKAAADGAGGAAAPSKPSKGTAPTTKASGPTAAKSAPPSSRVRRGDTPQERVVLREIAHRKAIVMLFWSATGADDVAVRGVVRSLNRHHGKVKVHVIPIGHVGDYGSITRGVKIAQSPTTLVIGRKGEARTIVGLTDPKELNQAVGDAIVGR
jgi:hypothetical protein